MSRSFRLIFLLSIILVVLAGLLHQISLRGHGLLAIHHDARPQIEKIALVTANDGLNLLDSVPVSFTGFLYLPRSQTATFRIPSSLEAHLRLDQQPIFSTLESTTHTLTTAEAHVDLAAGFHQLALEFRQPQNSAVYFQAGLEWQTQLGWQLVPPLYLFPHEPDPALAQRSLLVHQLALLLATLALLAWIMIGADWLWQQRWQILNPIGLGLLLLTLLAMGVRLLVLRELSTHPELDLMPLGSDQRGYYQAPALNFVRGIWPGNGAFYAKPGYAFFVGLIYSLWEPLLLAPKLVQMMIGALLTIPIFQLARRSFGSSAAWCAAILWLIFPYSIFYEAQILTHALEPLLSLAILCCWLKVLEDKEGWRWLLISGLLLGIAAIIRPTFLVAAPLIVATIAWQRRDQWRVQWLAIAKRAALLALITLVPIAPITIHNYWRGGVFQLISTEGAVTLYMGNHRDSSGFEWKLGPDAAFAATLLLVGQGKTDYRSEVIKDIRNDPERFLRLLVRKTALLFSDLEMSNNVDFYYDGVAISATLAALPLSFAMLLALALTGIVLGLGVRPPPSWGFWILLLYFAANCLILIVFLVLSRLLVPIYPVLIILGGGALALIVEQLRQHRWRWLALSLAILVITRTLIGYSVVIADAVMERPVVATLPAQVKAINFPINSTLTLVGYNLPNAAQPEEPIFVNLYWQVNQPLASDLMGSVQLLNAAGDDVLVQADHRLGEATYPQYKSSQWQPGEIVRDQYLLKIPADLADPLALPLLVVVYRFEDNERLGETRIGPLPITLGESAIMPPDATPLSVHVSSATLLAYRAERVGDSLHLTLYWQSAGAIPEDGVVFVHVLDQAQNMIAGQDQRPRNGTYPTTVWQAGEGIIDQRQIPLPAEIADQPLYLVIGMYNATTQERLLVVDQKGNELPDRTLLIGPLRP